MLSKICIWIYIYLFCVLNLLSSCLYIYKYEKLIRSAKICVFFIIENVSATSNKSKIHSIAREWDNVCDAYDDDDEWQRRSHWRATISSMMAIHATASLMIKAWEKQINGFVLQYARHIDRYLYASKSSCCQRLFCKWLW